MTALSLTRDINGFNTFGTAFSSEKASALLANGVEDTVQAPSSNPKGYLAVFSYQPGASVWVALNATAVVPASTFSSTNSELNPSAREVPATSTLHFITSDTAGAQLGVSFFALG